jgi:hypothetical protein
MRVSSTTVDNFALWLRADWMKEQSVIDNVKGIYKPGWQAEHGTAFHKIIETPEPFRCPEGYRADGILFPEEAIAECLPCFDRRGVFELKATKDYVIDGQTLQVVTKVDQAIGGHLEENKTKWGQFDIDGYLEAYQWRFYLDSFQALSIRYNVFCFDKRTDDTIRLKSIERFRQYPYPALHEDCVGILERFMEWIRARDLERYLWENRARSERAEAA